MPKLLVFAPCEAVLIGQDNSASLITLLHQLTLQIGQEVPEPIPPNSAAPLRWHIFSQWEVEPDEVGVRFEQKIEMFDRNERTQGIQTIGEFVPEAGKPLHRMIVNLTFFPLIPAGDYRLRLAIRRAGEAQWNPAADYPLQVIYQRVNVQAPQAAV